MYTISSSKATTSMLIIPFYTEGTGIYTVQRTARLADTIAAVSCLRYLNQKEDSETSVATASMEYFNIHDELVVGDFLELNSQIIATTNKSMIVDVEIFKEVIPKKQKTLIGDACFIYVALKSGKVVEIPQLAILSDTDCLLNNKGTNIISKNRERRQKNLKTSSCH